MEKTTVYLTRELKAALTRAARAQGKTEAELIREGVRTVTGSYGSPAPELPLFASGDETLAERVDEALAGFGER